MTSRTVVIMSGGMDSVCFAAKLARDTDLYAITFRYGQRAEREVSAARYFANLLRMREHRIVDMGFMGTLYGSSNALTDSTQSLSRKFSRRLIVPARNALFITIASAWALSIGAKRVAYGAHTGDVAYYPDCRPEFTHALQDALNLGAFGPSGHGTERKLLKVISPAMMGINKHSLARLGYKMLGPELFKTWSCYSNGIRSANTWTHCGKCESCISRRRALKLARIKDLTRYASKDY